MNAPAVRLPAMAGRFYPGRPDELQAELKACMPAPSPDPAVKVCIGPHAGYVYSGRIYGEMLAQVEVPGRVVMLGPNHTGMGARVSLWSGGPWRFPGFEVGIDQEMVDALAQTGLFELDHAAHRDEHCLEVQVPFLARRQPRLQLTPVVLSGLRVEDCRLLGERLAAVIESLESAEDPILLSISTDMNHFESAERSARLDAMALERLEAMDAEGLYRVVRREGISMCGFIPTTVALFYAHARGLKSCRLVRYGHSGEVSGDHSRVVGYAGLVIS